ncbi:MAG: ABC transporter permease, partial [Chitinophagales bacterium]
TPGQIRKIVFQEAAIMSLVGIPVGLACGVLAMKVVMLLIGTMDNNALVFLQEMRIGVSLPVMIVSAVLGIITVILSALGPARKAGQVSPLEAVRNSGSYSKEDFSKVRKQGLASFLPGVTSQMAFKNLRRNRGRFRITVFSMAISIVLYIVFGSFVNFIYTVGGVDRPPNADFLVSIKKGGPESFTAGQYKDMKALPGVERVYKDLSTDVTMGVDESRVNSDFTRLKGESLKAKQGDTILYRQAKLVSYGKDAVPDLKKALKDMSLAEVNRAKGVILVGTSMVNDTQNKKSIIIRPFNYQVGDTIPISPTPGEHWGEVESETVTVLGIMDMSFLDNNYTQDGEILMITTEDVYRQITGSQSFVQMALKLRPGADAEPVGKYLKEWCARDTIYDYTSIAEMVDSMKNAAFTMSVFLYGFVAVIALIGCLNIINTISTNLLLRTRELSILRAVGLTRRGIRKLVATEGTLYGVIAAIYGSIIGTGLAYLLYRIIGNIRGFEWSIPWTQIVVASLGAIVIALISGYIPLKRINEGIIVENLRRVD